MAVQLNGYEIVAEMLVREDVPVPAYLKERRAVYERERSEEVI
jgi:hypothetical protein